MAKTLILAPSGFGKSTSVGNVPEFNIQGLNPETTYIVSVTSKPLPFRGSGQAFKVTTLDKLKEGRRVVCNNAIDVESALLSLKEAPIEDVVIDDFNYIMQDWYMDNALSKGWDAPKQIGVYIGKIFKAIEELELTGKNIFVLAHGEAVPNPDGRTYFKLKTTGKMVDEYVTPEGKFDITLIGISRYDQKEKKVVKEYLTNENEQYSSAKSAVGMFSELTIPNDLSIVKQKIKEYYYN